MKVIVLGNRLRELAERAGRDPGSFDLFGSLKEMVALANRDEGLRPDIAVFSGSIMVFIATDTGRSVTLEFCDDGVKGRLGASGDFDLKFEATEKTFLELLSGHLDPDSAFFRREIKITGNICTAMRFKNVFFSKILPSL